MKLIRFSPHSTALMFSIVSLAASAGANTEIPTDTPAPTPSASPAPTPKVLTSFNGILGARYDASQTTGNSYKRLQDSVVFGFTITPAGVVDLV